MTTKIQLDIQPDAINRISKAKPITALSELIWNSLDADATRVDISIEYHDMQNLSSITVKDNGSGMTYSQAEGYFKNLGGSWKSVAAKTKRKGRYLHGKAGQGRLKSFSLGRVVNWNVVYDDNGQLKEYDITMLNDSIRYAEISDPIVSNKSYSGVTVTVKELERNFTSLNAESGVQSLAETFALYLKDYSEVKIYLDGQLIDPSSAIQSERSTLLENSTDDVPFELNIIEWKSSSKKTLYFCNKHGFPLMQVPDQRFHIGKYAFTAYIKSPYITKIFDANLLYFYEQDDLLNQSVNLSKQIIKDYFLGRANEEATDTIEKWKKEDVYPYTKEPETQLETVERQIFNVVAVTVNDNLPEFSDSSQKNKAFQLRMLRQAIENSPEELQFILTEVLNLPVKKQNELADLLRDVDLSAIISSSKLISDRLKFLTGLETILFDTELKKHLKERTQLHRMVLDDFMWMGYLCGKKLYAT